VCRPSQQARNFFVEGEPDGSTGSSSTDAIRQRKTFMRGCGSQGQNRCVADTWRVAGRYPRQSRQGPGSLIAIGPTRMRMVLRSQRTQLVRCSGFSFHEDPEGMISPGGSPSIRYLHTMVDPLRPLSRGER